MVWLLVAVLVLARVLRLRLGVVLALPCALVVLLWLTTAIKTGPQIAGALIVGSLVGLMLYADRPWNPSSRRWV